MKNGTIPQVRVAESASEASSWTGLAVVVDVLRCSTTICALLESGRNDVRVYSSPEYARSVFETEKEADLFSELDFGPFFKKNDNSPYLALRGPAGARPALSVTGSGTPAIMSLRGAGRIIIGCFANFRVLVDFLKNCGEEIMIVPACLYLDPAHVEDILCAKAIAEGVRGGDTVMEAVGLIHSSGRPVDFIASRPETGKEDLRLALDTGRFAVLPQVKIEGVFGRVTDILARHKPADIRIPHRG